ncbi:DUF2225 domain-containing protein [Paenibacillus sp. 1011MAR3C5]|uniref:DUF2225 domain-containing protein n=1 Tax=Paenibacillus sp. 1011MAR3C5 TaxID=1675787 RepID=UPI000E6D220E|nr:DUF2225 domain-containing protein [Paenibacillus sp. 1011MAR3C5]RJE91280.1 DUF2225 domain-containing protein [Paenibacillus sp. 1011MAR3C5]
MEPLYESKISCICCETIFQSTRVRPSFKRASAVDSDFCGHYDNGVNPDFYVVRICPSCGFASTENGLDKLNDTQKKNYYDRIGNNWKGQSFNGERTAEQAMASYKLALLTAQVTGVKDRVIAGLLHHIAWLYRYEKNVAEEQRFLKFALEAYVRVFELEGVSVNNAKLMYLMGELNRRIGELNEAVKWFSRVVNDKKIMDAAMIRASREQWQLIRQEAEENRLGKAKPASQEVGSA